MTPLTFSIVVPAYNSVQYLAETLASVRRQSYPHFEVLVVDDASTDSTAELATGYAREDDRFHLLRLERNSGGPAIPRNRGIQASKGDYVAFLDSDDLWEERKLENDAQYLARQRVDALFSGAHFFKGDRDEIVYSLRPKRINFSILFRNSIAMSTLCIRRDIFDDKRFLFDTDPLLVALEDHNLILNLYLSGKAVCSRPGTDTLYRFNSPTSISQNHRRDLVLRRAMYNLVKTAMQHSFSFGKLLICSAGLMALFLYRRLAGKI
jgi:teichuronic acid biosynthesis glycosyltransferase TuaG